MRIKINFDFLVFGLLLILGAFLGACFMYENKWDFTNYHYYGPWAFLRGRIGYDIAPASVNTYFNPLIDMPFYFMAKYFGDFPQFVSAVWGCFYGVLLFVFYKICVLFLGAGNRLRCLKIALAMLIGGSGYAVFFQISTTTNEIQTAILVLWGFYLLVKGLTCGKTTSFVFAGFLFGMAMGLKLTAVIYCVSAGVSLIFLFRNMERPLFKISVFAFFGLTGFLLCNGYWMWLMWTHFDNPFFPFANAIFKSEYYVFFNYSDTRFLPKNWIQFIFYPFFWIVHNERYVSELTFIDPRFAILWLIAFVWLLLFICGKTQTSLPNKFLYLFMFMSYVVWLSLFSIIRYLIPVEMLAAVVFVQVLFLLDIKRVWLQILVYPLIVVVIYIMLTVVQESEIWGSRSNDIKLIDVEDVQIRDNSLIILYNMPLAAVGAHLAEKADNVRLIGTLQYNTIEQKDTDFSDKGKFRKIKDELISSQADNIIALVRLWCSEQCLNKIAQDERLNRMYCRKLKNNLDESIFICRYQKWFDGNETGLKKEIDNLNNTFYWHLH